VSKNLAGNLENVAAKKLSAIKLFSKVVLTTRGAIGLAAGVLLSLAAFFENDLAAAVLGPSLILVTILLTALTVWAGRVNLRKMQVALAIQNGEGQINDAARALNNSVLISQTALTGAITVSGALIPPTYTNLITPIFAGSNNTTPEIFARLAARSNGTFSVRGAFPHRGNWVLSKVNFVLTDLLAASSFNSATILTNPVSFRVEPVQELHDWTVISSVERAGDTVQLSNERLGARLDLKNYHPADGMSSIAWKIFARRGELLARHPEAASTPEGTVLIFVAATTIDDAVAGAAVAYAKRCEELGSTVIAGVLGSSGIAHDSVALLDLTLESAFLAAAARLSDDLALFIKNVSERAGGASIRRIAVILPQRTEALFRQQLVRCSEIMRNANIIAVVFSVNDQSVQPVPVESKGRALASNWFLEKDSSQFSSAEEPRAKTSLYLEPDFLTQTGFEIGAGR